MRTPLLELMRWFIMNASSLQSSKPLWPKFSPLYTRLYAKPSNKEKLGASVGPVLVLLDSSARLGIPLTIQRGHSGRMQKSPKKVSKWVSGPPSPGGPKSQKRVKNELKSLRKVDFELVFSSCLTFLPPGAGRLREPILRLFLGLFHIRPE